MCPLWVHRFAVVTAGATLVLIFVGALVTSTGSGLAVPDWPLSFGQVFPPMVGGVLFEHGHRLVAACVGLLTVTLMVLLTQWEPRAWVRWLARDTGIPLHAMAGVGDATGDMPFMQLLAWSAAPANAQAAVKQMAHYTSPYEDGQGLMDILTKVPLSQEPL